MSAATAKGSVALIPANIVEAAAEPSRKLFRSALKRLPAVYVPLMTEMADRFLDPKLDMKDLWAEHSLNEKNHSKLLTQALGTPPWKFNRMCRALVASRLLADERIPTMQLYSIAIASGFKSTPALNAAFKAWSGGVGPTNYRKDLQAKGQRSSLVDMEALQVPRPSMTIREILRDVYRLAMQGACDKADFDTALGRLREAEVLVECHALPDLASDIAAHRGLVHHCHGTDRRLDLDIDDAYANLAAAGSFYATLPRLPKFVHRARERLLCSDHTRFLLMNELCVPCRALLVGEEGRPLRKQLSRALEPVPPDLEWFQVCCDPCYRVVWEALGQARLGLMDDAWKAFWLVAHADPVEDLPPSLARYVRILHESEILTHQAQPPRLELCRLAVETARELGDPLREAYALCFVANALRAMGRFVEARATLQVAKERCQESPWAAAFHALMAGNLAAQERDGGPRSPGGFRALALLERSAQ